MKEKIKAFSAKIKDLLLDDEKRINMQYLYVYAILSVVALFMSIVNIFTKKYLLMSSTLVFSVLTVINGLLCKKSEKGEKIAASMFSVEILLLFTFFLVSGTPEGFSAIWICMLPASGLLLFKKKRGTILCAVMFVIMVALLWTPLGDAVFKYQYTKSFRLRFPMLYTAFFAVSFFLESVRATTYAKFLEVQKKYEYLYLHDALTGVYNRYGFTSHMEQMLVEADTDEVALMMLDIDRFKEVNDDYGHACGDKVLKLIADVIVKETSDKGQTCRWGGEEFVVAICDASCAKTVADGIMDKVRALEIESDGRPFRVTVSIGIACADKDKASPETMVKRADDCMYKAKKAGRDCVVTENI